MGAGHRNCVVLGCPNSGAKLGKWAKATCDVHGCNNGLSPCDCQPPFRLFPFPTEKRNSARRLQWAKNISRNNINGTLWMPNKDSRVCSVHFVDGEPTTQNPDPTLELGHNKKINHCKRSPPTPRNSSPIMRQRKRVKLTKKSSLPDLSSSAESLTFDVADISNPTTCTSEESSANTSTAFILDHSYTYGWCEMNENPDFCTKESCLKNRQDKDREITKLTEKIQELNQKVRSLKAQLSGKQDKGLKSSDLRSDETVNLLTGIPSKAAFDKLFDLVKGSVKKVKYWTGNKKTSTTTFVIS